MSRLEPAVAPLLVDHRKTGTATRTLLNDSIVLYLAAVTAQKTWLLLNADLFELIRRVH